MIWLLKLQFDQNSIIINHKSNADFNSHIIFSKTQVNFLELLVIMILDLPVEMFCVSSTIVFFSWNSKGSLQSKHIGIKIFVC